MARVAIVGAGVSGLSVGVCLTDKHLTSILDDVTIITEKFISQGITSDNAGGFVIPSDKSYTGIVNSEQKRNARRWTVTSYKRFNMLYTRKVDCGLEKKLFYDCYEDSLPTPWFSVLHPELNVLSHKEITQHNLPQRLKTVWTFDCFLINPAKYLKFLHQTFLDNGGQMIQRRINNLSELSQDYDIIINCTGLGARELVGDHIVYPVRGQIIEVEGAKPLPLYYNVSPESDQVVYILSRNGRILLGGTADRHNWSTEVDSIQTESIYRKCVELCPQLEGSKVIGGWACLRPARDKVRLEVDREFNGPSLLIHNYGHGGKGFSLSWGCATDVTELVLEYVQPISKM